MNYPLTLLPDFWLGFFFVFGGFFLFLFKLCLTLDFSLMWMSGEVLVI